MKIIKKLVMFLLTLTICLTSVPPVSSQAVRKSSTQTNATLTAKVSYKNQTVSLKWPKVDGATAYHIYRSADWQMYEKDSLATVKGNSYTDTTAFSAAKEFGNRFDVDTKGYSYGVLYEKNGKRAVLCEKTVSFVPSTFSVKVTASTNCSQVTLKWTAASNCTAYRIYEKPANGNSRVIKNISATSTSYTVKNRKPNTSYQYLVCPYTNVGGRAIFCPQKQTSKVFTVKVTTKKIATPALKSAAKSGSKYTLKWGSVSGVTGYRVYKKTSNGWKKVADTKGSSYTVSKGIYTVRAYVTCSSKTYWGGYNKTGIKTK